VPGVGLPSPLPWRRIRRGWGEVGEGRPEAEGPGRLTSVSV